MHALVPRVAFPWTGSQGARERDAAGGGVGVPGQPGELPGVPGVADGVLQALPGRHSR